jgi:hypothetical protein
MKYYLLKCEIQEIKAVVKMNGSEFLAGLILLNSGITPFFL